MSRLRVSKYLDGATLPTRKNSTDAGLDLYAYVRELRYDDGDGANTVRYTTLQPGEIRVISTMITVEIPSGYFGWITNKSKNNFLIGGGIIDEGYQGELLVKVINTTGSQLRIEDGQAIAQLLIIPCKILDIEEVPLDKIHQDKTARGITGGIVQQINVSTDPNGELFIPIGDSVMMKIIGYSENGEPIWSWGLDD